MCQNVPPLELLRGCQYTDMTKTFKAAVTGIALKFDEVGDGILNDDYLRKGVLGPKQWAAFTALLLSWGWLTRGENGNLRRAGLLAPSEVDEHHDQSAVSPDALRMQIKRAIRAEFETLGLAARTSAEQSSREGRTESAPAANKSATEEPQAEHPVRTEAEQTELDSLDSLSSSIDSSPLHSKDSNRSIESPPLVLAHEWQSGDVRAALMAHNLTESQAVRWLKELPLSSIVDGIDYLRSGGWPKSKDPATTLDSYFKGKLHISKQWLERREAARNQTAAVMSIDGGGQASARASTQPARNGTGPIPAFNTGDPPPIADIRAMSGLTSKAASAT